MKIRVMLLILFISIPIFADNKYDNSCDSNLDDHGNPAFVTFFGDSLGDFVDFSTHGIFGWTKYLKLQNPDVRWGVQNFAKVAWKTKNVIGFLKFCMEPQNRSTFVTANHVAFEIGGNDLMQWTPTLIFMPWKMASYTDPITGKYVIGAKDRIIHNVRVITRILRHQFVDKDVLIMGNFPTLAYSPTMGHIEKYFGSFRLINSDTYFRLENEDRSDLKSIKEFFVKHLTYLSKVASEYIRNQILVTILGPWGLVPFLTGNPDYDMQPTEPHESGILEGYAETADEWYLKWVYISIINWTTPLSLGLGWMQGDLEHAAYLEREITRNQESIYSEITLDTNGNLDESKSKKTEHRKGGDYVHFLSLYPAFIFAKDCQVGHCWVGNPFLFADGAPGHVNLWGYIAWSNQLAIKFVELGWHNDITPRNNGKVVGTTTLTTEIQEVVSDVPPPPSEIDWVLLFCLLTGKCW